MSFDVPSADRTHKPFILEDGAWKKVRSITQSGECTTWNLRVDEDESFVAENCIVKNCPLQLGVIDRCITLYSNPGDIVADPFTGIGSVGYQALKRGRRFVGTELKPEYFRQAVRFMEEADSTAGMDLFSMADAV
jgi:hypothetical protein